MTEDGAEDEAARLRAAMVQRLERLAASDRAVLAAMRELPREAFVPAGVDAPLTLVYDVDRAVQIRAGLSSLSAPRVVAWMLELLELRPGMRVLEIGAGSGYNAALLRRLVGRDGLVVSVDVDAALVEHARVALAATGADGVRLVAGDGYAGAAEYAPYDRVVATVGCRDVAPAWLDQLAPGGYCLLPLQHGGLHPLTKIRPAGDAVEAVAVSPTGFVGIQGRQAGASPWPRAGERPPGEPAGTAELPAWLAVALAPEPGRETIGARGLFDLDFLLALQDRRCGSLLSLLDDGSAAWLDVPTGRWAWSGPAGPALRARLVEVAEQWRQLGWPRLGTYRSTFVRRGAPSGDAVWSVERLDFRQDVRLG